MPQTKEYNIKCEAIVDGEIVRKVFGGFSSTQGFSPELLTDLASAEFEKVYPGKKVSIKTVELLTIT